MNNIPARPAFALAFAFLLLPSPVSLAQGSLTPPPGAPAPTMKSLDQVEPRTRIPGGTDGFTISSAGSYYLSGNLATASGSGIAVNASNVTIDLGGFEMAGTGSLSGIYINAGVSNVTIRNGTIRGFGSYGVNGVSGNQGSGILAEGLADRIEGNSFSGNFRGIRVTGDRNLILRNSAHGNTSSNYVIEDNNLYGPIIDLTAGGAASATGNSAADTTTTTHPWANFSH